MSEGYIRIAEKRIVAWTTFEAPYRAVRVTMPTRDGFDGVHPPTRYGWKTLEQLLQAGGFSYQAEIQKIGKSLKLISIYERRDEICRHSDAGAYLSDSKFSNAAQRNPAVVALLKLASNVVLSTTTQALDLNEYCRGPGYHKQAQLQMRRIAEDLGVF